MIFRARLSYWHQQDLADYYRALDGMARWSHYCNYKRPHSALNYLRPVDYYRGDATARLAEREQKLLQALSPAGLLASSLRC